MSTSPSVFERLKELLNSYQIDYRVLQHEPEFTSEEAARVRGTSLTSGAKALICKVDEQFAMFVLPANRRLVNKQVRQTLRSRRLRFANREEVLGLWQIAESLSFPLDSAPPRRQSLVRQHVLLAGHRPFTRPTSPWDTST